MNYSEDGDVGFVDRVDNPVVPENDFSKRLAIEFRNHPADLWHLQELVNGRDESIDELNSVERLISSDGFFEGPEVFRCGQRPARPERRSRGRLVSGYS